MLSITPISIFVFWCLFFSSSCLSETRFSEAYVSCGDTQPSDTSSFIQNFVSAMEDLAELVSKQGWGIKGAGIVSPSPVFALAQCFGHLSHTGCLLCFAECRTKLPKCLPATSALIFLDGCFVRYENYSFYKEISGRSIDRRVCAGGQLEGAEKGQLSQSLQVVIKMAIGNDKFGVMHKKDAKGLTVYGMAQCWMSLDTEECKSCLEKAGRDVMGCFPMPEGRMMNAGCFLRYSTEKFYNERPEVGEEKQGISKPGMIIGLVSSFAIVVVLSIFGGCVGYRRLAKKREEIKRLGKLSSTVCKSPLYFKYEALEKATNYFDASRKLGQGGSGSVYQGTLSDGRVVAIKRLFFNTTQWVDDFFNEVNLISGVEHRNLVKLLGCSIEGPESLLVYEYVPNKSLDHLLFDKEEPQSLNWKQRFDIIVGTAEGLSYLHGGAKTRIIHRDIKSSNILLDENLKPKIADFGLVRSFSADQSHLSTGIAGTLGYVAPEYLVRGQLTDKADVYSFGVLVLEIVCGRKNSIYAQETSSLLHMVWNNYKSNTLPESVDQRLKHGFPTKQASEMLQIGLLCTQASVTVRPSMSQVLKMLTCKDVTIPIPQQPPFLNSSILEPNSPVLYATGSSLDTSNSLTDEKS